MPPNSATPDSFFPTGPALLALIVAALSAVGFALLTAGLSRAKNASHTIAMSLLGYALGTLGFFVCGFALMFRNSGFFLHGHSADAVAILTFLLMATRINIAVAIPPGALAERWRLKSFILYSFLLAAVICPVYAGWVWGGGWISRLGAKLGGGHGGLDYAGSAVVHLQAGMIALVAAWMIGPRLGKYDDRGHPRPILAHNVPMAVVGSLILAVAWLGLNVATSLSANDGRALLVAVNTVVALSAGALAACLHTLLVYGKPDPTMACNGLFAGIVAIAAPCAFVQPWAALLIGAVAGVVVIWSVFFWERRGIDDPVGVISVHGMAGLWGTLALGLFADGSSGHGVDGLFYGDSRQLLCQLVMLIACIAWSILAGGAAFGLVGWLIGGNRVAPSVEYGGLDLPEVGIPAYPEFLNPMPAATVFVAEPRPATAPGPAGSRRFSVVIEGIDPSSLISAWSSLCQVGSSPPLPDFKAVYRFVTTVTGNRFRFSGGDPDAIKQSLVRLFQTVLKNDAVSAKLES